jgi:hypothetical protein
MSMLDKLKDMMKGHENTARKGVDKSGDAVDKKTGNKYENQVDTGQRKMDEQTGNDPSSGDDNPPRT